MDYNLRFKYKNKRGYWCTTIYADTDEQAIDEAKEYLNRDDVEKIILEKLEYKYKQVYREDKNNG